MELKDFTMNNIHALIFFNVEIKQLPLPKYNNSFFQLSLNFTTNHFIN